MIRQACSLLAVLLLLAAPAFAVHQPFEPVVEVIPPAPTAADAVSILVKSLCPTIYRPVEIAGGPGERVIRIEVDPEATDLIGAPCFSTPIWERRFDLGNLAPGSYRVRVVTPVPGGGEAVVAEAAFQVAAAGDELLLHGGRFALSATWRDGEGNTGVAHPVALTSETGFFWFFDSGNVEVVAKVLDACASRGRWWVFLAGLTNVEVDLTVVDTRTGQRKTYRNPPGRAFQPVLDTSAFATCP